MLDRLAVGTSGWQYADWRPDVYPPGLPQRRWLEHYGTLFATVEVNSSFYRLPSEHTARAWASETPDDFRFAIKASRYLTHVRRLAEPEAPVDTLLASVRGLGKKLGPILVQLPPRMTCRVDLLEAALAAFGELPVAVEVRDERWHCDEVYETLQRHAAALVWWDRRGAHGPLVRTADWLYLRLHDGRGRDRPSYGRRALSTWVERIQRGFGSDARGWVYCNNDVAAAAAHDAARFAHLAGAAGFAVTRSPREVSGRLVE